MQEKVEQEVNRRTVLTDEHGVEKRATAASDDERKGERVICIRR